MSTNETTPTMPETILKGQTLTHLKQTSKRWKEGAAKGAALQAFLDLADDLMLLRSEAMNQTESAAPKGRGYNERMGHLVQTWFPGLDNPDRIGGNRASTDILWLRSDPERWELTQKIRADFSPAEAVRVNTPQAMVARVRKMLAQQSGDEPKARRTRKTTPTATAQTAAYATAMERTMVEVKAENQDLQTEVSRLKRLTSVAEIDWFVEKPEQIAAAILDIARRFNAGSAKIEAVATVLLAKARGKAETGDLTDDEVPDFIRKDHAKPVADPDPEPADPKALAKARRDIQRLVDRGKPTRRSRKLPNVLAEQVRAGSLSLDEAAAQLVEDHRLGALAGRTINQMNDTEGGAT